MAQWERAGLITPRSYDRNILSVFKNRNGAMVARGAHNPEVIGSNPFSGMFNLLF